MSGGGDQSRAGLVRRGQRLEYLTVVWNGLEAIASIAAGMLAGSVSLTGFGLDSVIEVASGAALLWRLRRDPDPNRRERAERRTLRIVGTCFLALAAYIVFESVFTLLRHEAPETSAAGIVIAALALLAMPLLARAKRRVATGIGSGAMYADSRQTDFCAYLSAILLAGLLSNALFGWWWADPVSALVMTPIIVNEGISALRGKTCCGECGCAPR
jgi:divalent metal cation (Fe/Co/Zn/Cd) transporter